MRRRVTYRPSKASSILGIVTGGIFVLIGLTVVIPQAGPFGLLWTAGAAGITIVNACHAFGNKYVGPEIHIEDEDGDGIRPPETGGRPAAQRLQELEQLRASGLISPEEYEQKRQDILKSL